MDIISYSLASDANDKVDLLTTGNSLNIPFGTTGERPAVSANDRAVRYNTDTEGLEEWNGTEWENLSADITAVEIKGTDTEANILLKSGTAGDIWVASDTLDGWLYDGTNWLSIGALQGPQGVSVTSIMLDSTADLVDTYLITYSDATTSTFNVTNGKDGATWLSGSVDPTTEGVEGDMYLNTVSSDVFKKTTGAWSVIGNIKGATGEGLNILGSLANEAALPATGNTGDGYIISGYLYVWTGAVWENVGLIQGPQGIQGEQGIQGIQGEVGRHVDHISKTSGDGSSGTTDTYTAYLDVSETEAVGTFDVYNGQDGVGSTLGSLTDVDLVTTPVEDGQAIIWNEASGKWVPGDAGSGDTVAPELATLTATINEGVNTDIAITNWLDSIAYDVESLDPLVATVSRVGNTITISALVVPADASTTVRVRATVAGLATSEWTNITVNVIDIPVVEDQAFVAVIDNYTNLANMQNNSTDIEATAIDTTNIIETAGVDTFDTAAKVVDGDLLNVDGTDMVADGVAVVVTDTKNATLTTNGTDCYGENMLNLSNAFYAFNGVIDYVCIGSSNANLAIVYDFKTKSILNKFAITDANSTGNLSKNQSPNVFEILGSNDDSTWVELDSKSGVTWDYGQRQEWATTQTVAYRYYKMHITTNNGHGSYCSIGELEFFTTSTIYTIPTATVTVGAVPTTAYTNEHRAIYDTITQDVAETDFKGMTNIEATFEYTDINVGSTTDVINTTTKVADGDNLVVVNDSDVISEIVASGVTDNGTTYSIPHMGMTATSKVYAVDSDVSFKFGSGDYQVASKSGDVYTYSSPILSSTRNYNRLIATTNANTFDTKTQLKAVGDKMKTLEATVLKEV